MDDSDEYFDDSFVLDEAALASIQATEERFGASLSQVHPTRSLPAPPLLQAPSSLPPSKRLKTSHGSIEHGIAQVPPQPVIKRMQSLDLNPEIRVGPDGNYVVGTQSKAPKQAARSGGDSSGMAMPKLADIQTELASVRAQLAVMNTENEAIQKSLREAQDAQFVKAGEVSILRQTIEKTNKEHAEAMAKAKADMIAHEKIKAELQAKLKEETERLATRLVFQQHEMETSTRKPTWGSVRSRRIVKDPSMPTLAAATPTRAQSPFLSPSTSHSARQVALGKGTQDQQGGGGAPLSSPTSGCRPTRCGEDARRPRFKGFHNAFIDSGPVVAQSPVSGKEGNAEEIERSDPFLTPMKPSDSGDMHTRDSGKGKGKGKGTDVTEDFQSDWWEEGNVHGREMEGRGEDMIVVDQEEGEVFFPQPGGRLNEEDMIIEEGVEWGEELRRIVFTHIAPRNNALTLHILLSTLIPPETPVMEKHAYMTACQIILETCGARHGHTQYPDDSDWEADVIHRVADAFVIVGGILGRAACIAPLTALLDLLLLLILYIPAFLSAFLGPPPAANAVIGQLDPDRQPQLLCMLCDVVREHLAPPNPNLSAADNINGKEHMRAALAMAVVQLMESLCWSVKDDLVHQLGVLPQQPQVLEILLDTAQAPELIARTLQLLVLLASRGEASPFFRDPSRFSLVEKLCYYLVEPAVEESYRIRHLVLTLISLLLDSDIEAHTILLDSVTLVPSLVICIAKLSRLLWEDDLTIMNTPNLANITVDVLYSSVNLLHHLVFVHDLSPVLGRKLIDATRLPGPFNGVTHMFIVTFGRLAWAEGPDWLDADCKDRCEVITENAMEIIETVVAGPECDSLWAVWHESEVIDEEELEAWKIQID